MDTLDGNGTRPDTYHTDGATGTALEERYFAASNSSEGFVSYFEDCFGARSGIDRLYVLKGGPGTGKSRFLRTVGQYAVRRGWRTVYYYCSSDPNSLDGLRLSGSGRQDIGLIDGTAPHAWELTLPGARENIVELGQFWNSDTLHAQRERIAAYGAVKAAAYTRTFRWLRAAGEAQRVLDSLVNPAADSARLDRLAARLLHGKRDAEDGISGRRTSGKRRAEAVAPDQPTVRIGLRRAYSMAGRVRFDTFERLACGQFDGKDASGRVTAGRTLCVGDRYGIGYLLTEALRREAVRRGLRTVISYDPLLHDRIDGLYIPEEHLSVLTDTQHDCTCGGDPAVCETVKALSLRRYVDAEQLRRRRPAIREATALREALLEGAERSLAEAADAHFALEAVYSAAMDFPAKERMTERFCAEVLG